MYSLFNFFLIPPLPPSLHEPFSTQLGTVTAPFYLLVTAKFPFAPFSVFWTCFALVVLLIVHCLTHWVLLRCLFCWPLILCLVCPVLWTLLGTLTILHWCELNWVILRGLLPPVLRLYVWQQSLQYTDRQSANLLFFQLQGELVTLYQMLRSWGVTQVATSSKDLRMI